ncbi:MAG: dihydrodipicolinate synthase family protein [Ardenticatenaceae bacterium]|nr:dihydrodipicolinate synthase family protein [Ardenticatenaceae bacterium]
MARYPQAILVSCEAPWDENERLLEDVFRREIRQTLLHYNHLYVFGTAGEGHAVNQPQFRQIVDIFYEETRGENIYPMIGLIGLSTPIIREKLDYAYNVGFRIFQMALPPWGALNDDELLTYFQDVCGAYPDAQFLHYNLPRAGRVLEASDYRRLIDNVPNLVATKNTGGGMARAAELVSQVGELQHFLGEANYAHGCMYGECSILASFGPTTPHKVKALFAAGQEKDYETLMKLQHGFRDLGSDLFGPLRSEKRMDGAYDKILVRLGGLEEMPLRLLSPYKGFTEAQYESVKRVFHEKYPDWVAR